MIQWDKKQFKTLVFFLLLSVITFAQERKTYTGSMQMGSYFGEAEYHYIVSNNDTIYDGPFQLHQSSLGALLEKEDTSFLFKGEFKGGIPAGQWQFQFGEFQSNSQSKVVDYEYRVKVSGIQEQGGGTIVEGVPDGKWAYGVNQIDESEIEKELFKSEFLFSKGVPQQNFKIENEHTVLVGRFLRNGLAQDEWSSYAAQNIDDTESWFFENGVLRKILLINEGQSQEINVFNTLQTKTKEIRLDAAYLTLVRKTIAINKAVKVPENGILGLLTENEGYYTKMATVLSQLGSDSFEPKLKVKVPYYPLDSLQHGILNSITATFKASRAIAKGLLNNSHLNIIKRSDSNALFNYTIVKQISETYLKPLDTLISYREQDIFEYMDKGKLIQELWPHGMPSKTIEIKGDSTSISRSFVLPNADTFNFEGNNLTALYQIATYSKESLVHIKESLSDRLANEEEVQVLNDLEESLIKANQALVAQIDSSSSLLSKNYKNSLQKIKELADKALSEYALIKNQEEKTIFGNRLKTCFEDLNVLSRAVIDLPTQIEEIKALYQDAIWNPFMATVMDEEVKKRIITAYTKIVVPHFLNAIDFNLNCENAAQWAKQIGDTTENVVILRENDTQKLERKLRKEKNPEEIIKLFNQFTTVKDK